MFNSSLKKIPTIPSKYSPGFAWSLKPLFLWMQIVGIPTDPLHFSSVFRRYAVLIVGATMVIWGEASQIKNMIDSAPERKNPNKSYTEWWTNTLFEYQEFASFTVINLNLFVGTYFQWKPLWQNVEEIERAMSFNETFYIPLRKVSYVAVTILVSETVFLVYRGIRDDSTPIESTTDLILVLGFWVTDFYRLSAIILFTCLAWTASMMLERLIDDLPKNNISYNMEISQQLVKWKLAYQLINNYIDKINGFFGIILLVYLARQVFSSVIHLYWFILEVEATTDVNFQMLLVFYIIRSITYVVCITMVSYRIKQKVLKAGRQLRKVRFIDNTVQCQIEFLIIDINLNTPRISAMGVFEIGPNLFPSFIGVALTNLIILFQFEIQSN